MKRDDQTSSGQDVSLAQPLETPGVCIILVWNDDLQRVM